MLILVDFSLEEWVDGKNTGGGAVDQRLHALSVGFGMMRRVMISRYSYY